MAIQPGYRVGQFVLERQLGEGGMAEVWLGRNVHLGSFAAVKFLNGQYASRKDIEERFLNEGRRQGALDHPNIVKVYGFDYAEGQSFLIMQYVDGEPLDYLLHRTGPMTAAQAAPLAIGVLQALEFAHTRGIVHRDVKPSNILIDRQGVAYLGDFGIVLAINEKRLTQTGTVMGTPHYMSPEQIAKPMEVDHRADIYSFGCVLYEMLTGKTPFDHISGGSGDTDFAVKMAHIQQAPPSPRQRNATITAAVEQVIMRCLAKEPQQRYANCGEVRKALAEAIVVATPPPVKSNHWKWVAGGVAATLLLASVAFWPKQPAVNVFRSTPESVGVEQSALLSWEVSGAKEVEIAGLGKQPASGSIYVKPGASRVYVLTGRNWWKRVDRELSVTVQQNTMEIRQFTLSPAAVKANEPALLTWEVLGAREVTIGGNKVASSGTSTVRVTETSSYTLRATGDNGVVRQERRVLEVLPAQAPLVVPRPVVAPPEVLLLEFTPNTVTAGQESQLRWNVRGATKVMIGTRVVDAQGQMRLTNLDRNLTANLVADGPGGRTVRTAELRVMRATAPPQPPTPGLQVRMFRADPMVGSGAQAYVNLHYDVPGASRITIQPEVGVLSSTRGTVTVFPQQNTRYTLTAFGAKGETETRTLDVYVAARTPLPPVREPVPARETASWPVVHQHVVIGNQTATCNGVLYIRNGRLIFDSRTSNDGFDVPFSEVVEVKTNRNLFNNFRTFHVRTKTRNFNFVPGASVDTVVAEINRAIRQ